MDITGHFESASCVIEVDGSATLAQLKQKLLAELGMLSARRFSVRMRGGGDIGNDDLRICDTEMDEGCAVELYCTGANITPGLLPGFGRAYSLALSPCDKYLAVVGREEEVSILDTETHERLCSFPANEVCLPAFSPCSEWISSVNDITHCAEVHDVKTGALQHSFGDEGDERWTTAFSLCGTKLLSCCKSKGLQVWDIATGVVVHEWDHIVECDYAMVVTGDRVATFGDRNEITTMWDYTTGVEWGCFAMPSGSFDVNNVSLSPNQRFIAACCIKCVRVWNIETGECVFEDVSENRWADVAVHNDIVAIYSSHSLGLWCISTGKQLLCREFHDNHSYGLAISSCGDMMMYGSDEGVEIVNIADLS